MNTWKAEFTDFKLSPYTGLTRESWLSAARYMLTGIFQHIDSIEDPVVMPRMETEVTYPHRYSTGEILETEKKAEIFEGLTRSFFIGSVMIKNEPDIMINGINLAEYYKKQILKSCCNKDAPAYVGTYEELYANTKSTDPCRAFQQTVETCALVIGLDMCKEHIWDTYTKEEKDAIAAFLASYAKNATVPQNWRLFNMLDMAFLYKEGYDIDESIMGEHAQAIISYYVGNGWYRDGQCFDYYSCWAFNVYGPIWCKWYGYERMPWIAKQFEENSNELMKTYPDMFDNDGFTNMWGRSCIYRNAATSAFDGNMLLKNPAVDPGLARRTCSGSLLQFLERDDFLWNGIPTLGFYGQFTPLVQGYSCAESTFWLGKAFLCLGLPADHPFWTATESRNSFDTLTGLNVKETVLDGPGLCTTNHKANGETILRSAKLLKTYNDLHGMWNYNKLAYSTKFPWESTPDPVEGGLVIESQMYVINDDGNGARLYPNAMFWSGSRDEVLYRRAFFDYKIENERTWVQGMDLADFPVPYGIFRADKLMLYKRPVTLTLGSFGFPDNGTTIERLENSEALVKCTDPLYKAERPCHIKAKAIVLKGTDHMGNPRSLAMTIYYGFDEIDLIHSEGTNPDSENSIVIYGSVNAGDRLYNARAPHLLVSQTITRNDDEDFTEEDIFPVRSITFTDRFLSGSFGPVTISLKNGAKRHISFEGIEGNISL